MISYDVEKDLANTAHKGPVVASLCELANERLVRFKHGLDVGEDVSNVVRRQDLELAQGNDDFLQSTKTSEQASGQSSSRVIMIVIIRGV